jgi:threonine dehydrogenase-like Zn-dependent dehydrogenase
MRTAGCGAIRGWSHLVRNMERGMAQAAHVTDVAIIGAGPVGLFAVF